MLMICGIEPSLLAMPSWKRGGLAASPPHSTMPRQWRSAAPSFQDMFEGFESSRVDVGDTTVFLRRKGVGRPLLLLHGFPQTHLMWHRVAPALARDFHVVCADLRGYGSSGTP